MISIDLVRNFDLRDLPDAFYNDPTPFYHALREATPVREMPDGSILLTRHSDLERVYRDTATFSSDKKIEFAPKFGASPLYEHHTTSLVFNDPPLHTRVRKAIVGALAPRALSPLEIQVEAYVDHLISNLVTDSEIDIVSCFASQLPIQIIGNLLCVPDDEREQLRDWSLAILGALEPTVSNKGHELGNQAVTQFIEYLEHLVKRRRAAMKDEDDDILSRLIREEDQEDGLLHHELLHNCIFILNAGHETTTNLISSGVLLLSKHPQTVDQLLAEPDLWPKAVEEILRLESPNQLGNRRATKPFEIDGKQYDAGTQITLCIGAANRDPAAFVEPDGFSLTRSRYNHFAFAGGPHLCAGLTVARIEGRVALSKLFSKFPNLSVTKNIVRAKRARFRSFDRLGVALTG